MILFCIPFEPFLSYVTNCDSKVFYVVYTFLIFSNIFRLIYNIDQKKFDDEKNLSVFLKNNGRYDK